MLDPVTLFHNPSCGTSRAVLALLEAAGFRPTIVEYLKTGWSRDQLRDLSAATRLGIRDLLRRKEPLAVELGLLAPDATEDRILDAMLDHPRLVERPIVQSATGAVLARPPDRLWTLLPRPAG